MTGRVRRVALRLLNLQWTRFLLEEGNYWPDAEICGTAAIPTAISGTLPSAK